MTFRQSFIRFVVILNGFANLFSGLALLFAPQWFFDSVADFQPFNRHFLGDVGAFILPLGIGLLIAARDPRKYRTLIGLAALGNILHIINHLYDDLVIERGATLHWLTNTLPLLVLAILLIGAYMILIRESTTKTQRLEGSPRA